MIFIEIFIYFGSGHFFLFTLQEINHLGENDNIKRLRGHSAREFTKPKHASPVFET
jgi:hypothetical protein